ncbi:hypothetical protein MTR67_002903 [Solanum verrucosum]|uniref:Uncharacterized protein n=1 Tax=Solanum verrucosum TaxID=315347 RepID=A0AAF0T9W2_SOLVR|nr:hypothetical protein MTR67_002903 [Solanum verrucosum]
MEEYTKFYIREIVRLRGVHFSIISYRDTQVTSQFSKSFHKGLGTQGKLSTTFHHQTDGYHSSIRMAPFEALYGSRCRSPNCWFEVGEVHLIGLELVYESMEKVRLIRERL